MMRNYPPYAVPCIICAVVCLGFTTTLFFPLKEDKSAAGKETASKSSSELALLDESHRRRVEASLAAAEFTP